MLERLEQYVALGDSMSIDRYPSLDLSGRGMAPPSLLYGGDGLRADLPVGAASLLARNVDSLWPTYATRDLATLAPNAEIVDLTMDGAMLPDVVDAQLPAVRVGGAAALVTLTVGGNDLLMAYGNSRSLRTLERAASEIVRDYERCVALIRARLPGARIILTTVYDPSDATGFIPDFHESGAPLPLAVLETVNAEIRRIGTSGEPLALADVHARFLGHGASVPEEARWYWAPSMIEPGARGASEIRAAWLDSLGLIPSGRR